MCQPQESLVLRYLEGKLSYLCIPFIAPLTLNYAEICQQYLERKAMHRLLFVVPLTMNNARMCQPHAESLVMYYMERKTPGMPLFVTHVWMCQPHAESLVLHYLKMKSQVRPCFLRPWGWWFHLNVSATCREFSIALPGKENSGTPLFVTPLGWGFRLNVSAGCREFSIALPGKENPSAPCPWGWCVSRLQSV